MKKEEVLDILSKKGYIISTRVDGDKIYVSFPKKLLGIIELNSYETMYKVSPKGIIINTRGSNYRIPCPSYARRIMIESDVSLRCSLLGYNENLIVKELRKNIDAIITITEEEKNLEKDLIKTINEAIFIEPELLPSLTVKEEIIEGFKSYLKFAEKGLKYDKKLVSELTE